MTLTDETKSIFLSKTFWGAVISVVAALFPHFFTTLGLGDAGAVADKIVVGVGFLLTVYGRMTASTAVSITGK